MNLTFESTTEDEVEFSFTNFLGQVTLKDKSIVHKGFNTQRINVENLPNGPYLIQVKTGMEILTKLVAILRKQ